MSDPQFNLLDEPWITVLDADGLAHELSILEVFRQAPELKRIVGEIPTQGFAVLRVLLAILARSVDGPWDEEEWHAIADSPPPMTQIETYCDRYRGRFYLFHPATPFFQVAGLHTAKNVFSGLEKLIAEVPAGHSYFTTRTGSGIERIGPAEAARWVVHAQAFDCSGIKSGAEGDSRVEGGRGYPIGTGWAGVLGGVYIEGDNLWQTLMLNTIPVGQAERPPLGDRPAWEAEPDTSAQAQDIASRPYGPLDLFTWQSRRIRLAGDTSGVTGVVLSNGDKLAPPYLWEREPMTAWRRSKPQQVKLKKPLVYMPLEHRPERMFWQGLQSMLPVKASSVHAFKGQDYVAAGVVEWAAKALSGRRESGLYRVTLRAVGMEYGPQSATFIDLVDDGLVVSPEILRESGSRVPGMVVRAVEATDEAVRALRYLAANLVQAAGGSDEKLVAGVRDAASARAYAALDQPFRRWLAELGPQVDSAEAEEASRRDWNTEASRIIRGIGGGLIADSGPAAWVGREVQGRYLCSYMADGWFHITVYAALPVPRAEPVTSNENLPNGSPQETNS